MKSSWAGTIVLAVVISVGAAALLAFAWSTASWPFSSRQRFEMHASWTTVDVGVARYHEYRWCDSNVSSYVVYEDYGDSRGRAVVHNQQIPLPSTPPRDAEEALALAAGSAVASQLIVRLSATPDAIRFYRVRKDFGVDAPHDYEELDAVAFRKAVGWEPVE